ncbi:hypothetical protein GA0070610_1859 [Micromonospora echinofusca]|uniref:Uncharacterized protein n=1 Tax=Micromonospora echinofusca TaxID=47858 RepID=A0A1C5G6S0_MICEH|nr:hypothetical protein [Micromonospora echinofusca]SCG15623.1 hypothetical protein GA0070610_1859 [Micromonospora echinofusca]
MPPTPLTDSERATARHLPLCGHWQCHATRPQPLDAQADVVMIRDCAGQQHLFRDGAENGLILKAENDRWSLARERYAHVASAEGDRWELVAESTSVCVGGWDALRREYVARHLPSGRVIARWDTQYGLLARAARHYLRVTTSSPSDQYATGGHRRILRRQRSHRRANGGQGNGRGVSLANSPRPPGADATQAPKGPYAEHVPAILRHTNQRPAKQ